VASDSPLPDSLTPGLPFLRLNHKALVFVLLACTGCAVHRPALQTWRLVKRDTGQVLVPPDISATDLAQRTLTVDVAGGHGVCPPTAGAIAINVRGKHARVTVTRDNLAAQPTGWLGTWAYQLEARHCLPPGEGMRLAGRIAESVPLEPTAAFHLLYPDDRQTGAVEIDPQMRLQVISPFLREAGVGLMADGPYTIKGDGYSLTVTGKSTENVLGYETALYAVQPNATRIGSTIAPLYADRNVQGKTERTPRPSFNYFHFPADAAFYRLFYKSEQNDFTALIIGARTPADLDQRTRILEASGASASCEKLDGGMCIAIPKEVAVHPLVTVTVNGAEVLMGRGGSVYQAIRRSGEQQPDTVLPRLTVYKPWNGRLIAVAFDPSDASILKLVLRGGETISWK
jgi:hypothetical protein